MPPYLNLRARKRRWYPKEPIPDRLCSPCPVWAGRLWEGAEIRIGKMVGRAIALRYEDEKVYKYLFLAEREVECYLVDRDGMWMICGENRDE